MLVLESSALLVAAGVILALAVAVLAAPALGGLMVNVSPHDPAVLIGTLVLVLGAAVLATAVPAIRALRVDPLVALREE